MAQSPTHKFGQIIGDLLEAALEPELQKMADRYGLYLDKKGFRKERNGKLVKWTDVYENTHELDFVFEKDGSNERRGKPVAFIETAWRRYTKHSKNKAQEIQGAIQPLLITHADSAPFAGIVLAGDFTEPSLKQLVNLKFRVLHFDIDM